MGWEWEVGKKMELLKDKNDPLMVPPLAQLVLEMASEIVFLAQLAYFTNLVSFPL